MTPEDGYFPCRDPVDRIKQDEVWERAAAMVIQARAARAHARRLRKEIELRRWAEGCLRTSHAE